MNEVAIHWFRRDLRLEDNTALYYALKSGYPVLPIFIFDVDILDDLKDGNTLTKDNRVLFIYKELEYLKNKLIALGSDLNIYYGKPSEVWKQILTTNSVKKVFTNHDYEPYAINRDAQFADFLKMQSIEFYSFKDQVIFEKKEVVKDDGTPYHVFTPYSKKWKFTLQNDSLASYPSESLFASFLKVSSVQHLISLDSMGFLQSNVVFPDRIVSDNLINHYQENRDYPSILGTSRLSLHLRFGTISIRKLARQALASNNQIFLNELIWREFYMMILYHYPRVVSQSFKPQYDKIQWRNNIDEFAAWCEGRTGYPIVDAGMRELNTTGFMHNRVRMIVASFLTKHLLIDWRWGEAYFAKKLLDYELSSNNGGWQWAAGTGVDAAPYFRVFNPALQTLKFDKDLKYIKKWVPEYSELTYVKPIVEHTFARNRCLEVYKAALG